MLLLDEPLGALDLKLRRAMQVELKRIQTEVGLTFVHVTHDQEEAMTMADTVAVMNAGRIEQLGAPAELYEYPATAFVANFLGQSNLLRPPTPPAPADGGPVTAHGARFSVPVARARVATGRGVPGGTPRRSCTWSTPPTRCRAGHQYVDRGGHRRLVRGGQHPVPGADRMGQ